MSTVCKSGKVQDFSYVILYNNNEFEVTLNTPERNYTKITSTSTYADKWITSMINTLKLELEYET